MASGSEIVTARGSSNDTAASAKSTLCFVRFAAALRGSHSNPCIAASVCTYVHRRQVIACSPRVKFCCGQELANRERPVVEGSIESNAVRSEEHTSELQ